jgi:hypothetical protein
MCKLITEKQVRRTFKRVLSDIDRIKRSELIENLCIDLKIKSFELNAISLAAWLNYHMKENNFYYENDTTYYKKGDQK